ncbi:MAG: Pup ligase PafA, possible component of postulated heterodimer PafA-PafA', partial [uncultured Friedmanniella sp.]
GPPDLRSGDRVRRRLHLRGNAAADPRRGGALPVPPGRHLGPQQQRLPPQRVADLPRRRLPPRVRHRRVRRPRPAGQPRPGRRADPGGPDRRRRAPAGGRGHHRRHLPVQEQHRQPRQLLRLPRELPDLPDRGLLQDHRRAGPVPGLPAADLRCRQGAADRPRAGVQPQSAGRAHLGERLLRDHPQPTDHQHPGRAARRPGALPAAARDRRRLQHERDHHAAQGGHRRAGAPADRGGRADARLHPGEPHPGDPGHEPGPDRPGPGGAGQRPPDLRPGAADRVLRTRRRVRGPRQPRHARHRPRAGPVGADAARGGRGQAGADRHRGRLGDQAKAAGAVRHQAPPQLRRPADRPAGPGLPRHPPRSGAVLHPRGPRPGGPGQHRTGRLPRQVGAAADHQGQAARGLHPGCAGGPQRLHRRLGPPEAERPGAADGALQGPVRGGRRTGRPADRLDASTHLL